MINIIDRQTVVISVNLATFVIGPPEVKSQVQLPINLRFAADELILKTIVYNNTGAVADVDDVIHDVIWCNITNDNLIGAFPNAPTQHPIFLQLDNHFKISNNFQTGNFVLQFQQTSIGNPASFNPQPLISSQAAQHTHGTVVMTIEFIKSTK